MDKIICLPTCLFLASWGSAFQSVQFEYVSSFSMAQAIEQILQGHPFKRKAGWFGWKEREKPKKNERETGSVERKSGEKRKIEEEEVIKK